MFITDSIKWSYVLKNLCVPYAPGTEARIITEDIGDQKGLGRLIVTINGRWHDELLQKEE